MMTTGAPASFPAEKRLREMIARMPHTLEGLRAVVISDPKGLPVMAHRLADAPTAAAMATLALTSAQRLAGNLRLPGPADVLIEGDGWKALIQSIGGGFTVFYVLASEVNLGLLRLSAEAWRAELKEILAELVRTA